MAIRSPNSPAVRFGAYEADPRTGELRKHGIRIKLQDQPFAILMMLLERPGELVTREQIQQKLWPADTFVDFDHSLNTAIRRLRDALNDSADAPRFIETLPRRGYRFLSPVEPISTPSPPGSTAVSEAAGPVLAGAAVANAPTHGVTQHWFWVGAAVAAAVAGIVAISWAVWPRPAIDSVAVLPLLNVSQDPALDYLSDGIAESITSSLSEVSSLKVAPRNAAFRYKGPTVDPRQAARELSVRAVLLGTLQQRGQDLHISIELVDAKDQRQLWGEEYDFNPGSALHVEKEISALVSEKLRVKLTGQEKIRIAHRETQSSAAYDQYLRGKYALDRRDPSSIQEAIRYFQSAADSDPSYALPYIGLSSAYGILASTGAMQPSEAHRAEEAAARRAMELDPDSAETHVQMGFLLRNLHRNNAGAEREFRRAIELNPRLAEAHHALCTQLAETGKLEEALAASTRSEQLDPFSLPNRECTTWVLTQLQRYEPAIAKAVNPYDGAPLLSFVGWIHVCQGKFEEAATDFERGKALQRDPNSRFVSVGLAYVYGRLRRKQEARAILDALLRQRHAEYVSAYDIATIYAGLGDKENMIRWLKTADRERDDRSLIGLRGDCFFKPYRDLPEVVAIERSVNTPD